MLHGDAYVTEAAWPCRAVSHLPMFTRTQRNPASMFELIFFATRPIKRTYINKQIQCNLLFLSAGRQRKINRSECKPKHIKVLLWTRVEQWPVSLIFNRYPARNPLFLTDKNYFGQESSSAAVVCMANRCKKKVNSMSPKSWAAQTYSAVRMTQKLIFPPSLCKSWTEV